MIKKMVWGKLKEQFLNLNISIVEANNRMSTTEN